MVPKLHLLLFRSEYVLGCVPRSHLSLFRRQRVLVSQFTTVGNWERPCFWDFYGPFFILFLFSTISTFRGYVLGSVFFKIPFLHPRYNTLWRTRLKLYIIQQFIEYKTQWSKDDDCRNTSYMQVPIHQLLYTILLSLYERTIDYMWYLIVLNIILTQLLS